MDEVERSELVCRLFALLTTKLEDASVYAVQGQAAAMETESKIALAQELRASAEEVLTLADAAGALCERAEPKRF
jgi:hypothetical protein